MSQFNPEMLCVKILEITDPEVDPRFFVKHPLNDGKYNKTNPFDMNNVNKGIDEVQLNLLNDWIKTQSNISDSKVDVVFD